MSFTIQNLHISIEDKEIVRGIDISVDKGQVVTIMGPNGSGKSTLANAVAGHPSYTITSGDVLLNNESILNAPPDERAKKGLFLSMQYPPEIPGVSVANFLRIAASAVRGERINPLAFHAELKEEMQKLSIPETFMTRSLNAGFSGGEKKRFEMLQMAVLRPAYAVLDETDSGLDVDALRIVADGINRFREQETGMLLITHYNRILEYVVPDVVHIMVGGSIVKTGGKELAKDVEEKGYGLFI